jgi:hypothetical protein
VVGCQLPVVSKSQWKPTCYGSLILATDHWSAIPAL